MKNPSYFETSLYLIFNSLEILDRRNSLWCKFHSHQFNRFLVACIFMEKYLIVCAFTGLESETGLSWLPASCVCECSESQTSMRFSLVYTSIWQSLIAWVFMQNSSNGDYIYWKWDSHCKDNEVSCWFENLNHFELTLGFM